MPTLDFKGKQHIYAHHLTVPHRPLVVDKARSVLPPPPPNPLPQNEGGGLQEEIPLTDQNLIIHGDNLQALKALLPHYAGRVKCIYIDPPYNTGNEGWVYNDNVNSPMLQDWFEKNSPVDGEDLERHDKWLCMMWPRLHLLRELLRDDGVIFVSIDDNEVHHLRMMMDEIFGEENFVANVIWQKKYNPQNDARYFSDNHDFIVIYAKQQRDRKTNQGWIRNLLPRTDKQNKHYRYDDQDGKGPWRADNLTAKSYSPEYDYAVVNPNTGVGYTPSQGTCWRANKETMAAWISEGRVFWGRDGKGRPQLKRYLNEVQQGVVPLTIWPYDEVGHTDSARKAIKNIFFDYNNPFDNPKPIGLIQRVLQLSTQPNPTQPNPTQEHIF